MPLVIVMSVLIFILSILFIELPEESEADRQIAYDQTQRDQHDAYRKAIQE